MGRHGALDVKVKPGWHTHQHLHDTGHISITASMLERDSISSNKVQAEIWEMENGRGWCFWKPEGVEFTGAKGEVLQFQLKGYDYRVMFGPEEGEGVQENLQSGRRRRLRRVERSSEDACTVVGRINADDLQQLCDMGFAPDDALLSLQVARGNVVRAVQDLLLQAQRS